MGAIGRKKNAERANVGTDLIVVRRGIMSDIG